MSEKQSSYVAGERVVPDSFQIQVTREELTMLVLAAQQAVHDWRNFVVQPRNSNAVAELSQARAQAYQDLTERLGGMLGEEGDHEPADSSA
jgi:hypothetical protein